jgi:hypothetical protein
MAPGLPGLFNPATARGALLLRREGGLIMQQVLSDPR